MIDNRDLRVIEGTTNISSASPLLSPRTDDNGYRTPDRPRPTTPIYTTPPRKGMRAPVEYGQCSICTECIEPVCDEAVIRLPCQVPHSFHLGCINPWFQRRITAGLSEACKAGAENHLAVIAHLKVHIECPNCRAKPSLGSDLSESSLFMDVLLMVANTKNKFVPVIEQVTECVRTHQKIHLCADFWDVLGEDQKAVFAEHFDDLLERLEHLQRKLAQSDGLPGTDQIESRIGVLRNMLMNVRVFRRETDQVGTYIAGPSLFPNKLAWLELHENLVPSLDALLTQMIARYWEIQPDTRPSRVSALG